MADPPRGPDTPPPGPPEPDAAGSQAPQRDGEPEHYGPIRLVRHRKEDGRDLILYSRGEER